MKKIIFLTLCATLALSSCSHPVMLNRVSSTMTYADRLPGRVGLFISPALRHTTLEVPASGDGCSGHKYPMDLGSALENSIRSGVETAVGETVVLTSAPTSEAIKSQGFKFALVPRVTNANGGLDFSSGFLSLSNKATFQASITINVIDPSGKTFYSFTATGNGFNNGSGSCEAAAVSLQRATENALQQIADNIAQTLSSATQIKEAAMK